MKYKFLFFRLISFVLLGAISSCSNTKFLKEGELLYTGAELEIEEDSANNVNKKEIKQLKSELEENLVPKPNSSFLGLRPRLYIYNSTKEPKKAKGLRNWWKNKIGQKPVLFNDVDIDFNKDILENYSENKGYFNAAAKSDTTSKNKKASIHYTLNPKDRYYIGKVKFPKDSSLINEKIQELTSKTLLKSGDPFDLDVIKSERTRIDTQLKDEGFYYFHEDNIIVQADSTVNDTKNVELIVKLKDNTPKIAKQQYSIDKVVIFPNYNTDDLKNGLYRVPMPEDSLIQHENDNLYIIDPEKKFKPKIFDRVMYVNKGDIYNRSDHNLTLNRLISLGVFKFVKNEFQLQDSVSQKFDAYYLLTPKEMQSLRLEVLGRTNSANYGGGEVNLNWTHRNFFKGAEQLKMALFGAFDVQLGGARDANNIIRTGFNTQLSIPRIVAPFRFRSSSAYVPRTNISLAYEFLNRTQLYTLHNFTTSFGYVWKENIRKEHDLKILDVTMVFPQNVTEKYQEQIDGNPAEGILPNPTLGRVVEKQLIFGPIYTYTYTTTMLPRTNTVYYKGMLDLAGNITGLITGGNAKEENQKELFNIPFSQFVKMENDFRYYHKFSEKSSFASRIIAGVAYPWGNSEYVPFSRQFFVGGSNSVRAFRARTLGPGSYDPRTQNASFFFDQAGDIKLELNAEYRANLFSFLNLGLFVDAGNIWLINEDETRPGGKFSDDFISEIAVGGGLGLRFDFSILVLRLDLAMPFRIPYLEKNERWVFDKIDFGDSEWRKDNLILNIAIGYPF